MVFILHFRFVLRDDKRREFIWFEIRPDSVPSVRYLYNGDKEQPDRSILKLSDVYRMEEEDPAIGTEGNYD